MRKIKKPKTIAKKIVDLMLDKKATNIKVIYVIRCYVVPLNHYKKLSKVRFNELPSSAI